MKPRRATALTAEAARLIESLRPSKFTTRCLFCTRSHLHEGPHLSAGNDGSWWMWEGYAWVLPNGELRYEEGISALERYVILDNLSAETQRRPGVGFGPRRRR